MIVILNTFFYWFQQVNMNSLATMSNPMERGGGRSVEQSMERKQLWNKWDNQKVRVGYNFSSLIVFFNSIALPYVYNYIHIVIIFCI